MNEQGLQIQCPVDKFSLFGPAAHGGDKGHQAESEEKDGSEGLTLPSNYRFYSWRICLEETQ